MTEKEVYEHKLEAEIQELRAKIEHLKAEMHQQQAESKSMLQSTIEELEQKKQSLDHKLSELKQATGSGLGRTQGRRRERLLRCHNSSTKCLFPGLKG